MKTFYVVHTHPCAESKAAHNLSNQGYDTYLPLFLRKRRHARRHDLVPTPLFPRYLFVGVNLESKGWRSICSTFGVSKLVSFGDKPIEVPKKILMAIKDRENDEGYISLWPRVSFKEGDEVELRDNLLGNKFARITEFTGNDRVTLLMELMGCQVRIRASLDRVTFSS